MIKLSCKSKKIDGKFLSLFSFVAPLPTIFDIPDVDIPVQFILLTKKLPQNVSALKKPVPFSFQSHVVFKTSLHVALIVRHLTTRLQEQSYKVLKFDNIYMLVISQNQQFL